MSEFRFVNTSKKHGAISNYAPRILEDTWAQYEHRIRDLHAAGKTRKEILEILNQESHFRPSLGQLQNQLQKWHLFAYHSADVGKLPSQKATSDSINRLEQTTIKRDDTISGHNHRYDTTATPQNSGADPTVPSSIQPASSLSHDVLLYMKRCTLEHYCSLRDIMFETLSGCIPRIGARHVAFNLFFHLMYLECDSTAFDFQTVYTLAIKCTLTWVGEPQRLAIADVFPVVIECWKSGLWSLASQHEPALSVLLQSFLLFTSQVCNFDLWLHQENIDETSLNEPHIFQALHMDAIDYIEWKHQSQPTELVNISSPHLIHILSSLRSHLLVLKDHFISHDYRLSSAKEAKLLYLLSLANVQGNCDSRGGLCLEVSSPGNHRPFLLDICSSLGIVCRAVARLGAKLCKATKSPCSQISDGINGMSEILLRTRDHDGFTIDNINYGGLLSSFPCDDFSAFEPWCPTSVIQAQALRHCVAASLGVQDIPNIEALLEGCEIHPKPGDGGGLFNMPNAVVGDEAVRRYQLDMAYCRSLRSSNSSGFKSFKHTGAGSMAAVSQRSNKGGESSGARSIISSLSAMSIDEPLPPLFEDVDEVYS